MSGNSGTPNSPEPLNLALPLLRAMNSMRSFDTVFPWLASTLVQRFGVPLAQFWTHQDSLPGANALRLLAMNGQDPSVPERIVVNEQITQIVEHITQERRASLFFLVEQAFPHYQAALLNRYGFNYCGCAFLESSVPLFQLMGAASQGRTSARFAVATFLLLRQLPRQDLLTAVNIALEQGAVMAAGRGLVFSSGAPPELMTPTVAPPASLSLPGVQSNPTPLPQGGSQPESLAPLEELIPRRKQDPDLLTANNPFTSTPAISDKYARRLHTPIDGRSTVGDLCRSTGLTLKEAYVALQFLVKQQRIELFDPKGRPVKMPLFLKEP